MDRRSMDWRCGCFTGGRGHPDHSPAHTFWAGDAGSQRCRRKDLEAANGKASEGTKVNLAQLLESLATQVSRQGERQQRHSTSDEGRGKHGHQIRPRPLSRGEVKVNAVHDMMEHMSRQMDTLRQILRVQEDKLSKAGVLVESHADILDRMFWAEIPEAGKKSVLLSSEATCVPPRNIRQFVELLFERDDNEIAAKILTNYCTGLDAAGSRSPPQDRQSAWLNSATSTPPRPRKSCPMPSR